MSKGANVLLGIVILLVVGLFAIVSEADQPTIEIPRFETISSGVGFGDQRNLAFSVVCDHTSGKDYLMVYDVGHNFSTIQPLDERCQ